MSRKRVLAVGNCAADNGAIRSLIERHFDAELDAAPDIDRALRLLRGGRFDLVLVNRIVDVSDEQGVDLVRAMRADPEFADTPVMLISNLPGAQAEAESAGARPGFGKATLNSSETIERLAACLPRKAHT